MSPDVLLRVREMLPQLSASERRVAEAVLADSRADLARAITLVESTRPDHRAANARPMAAAA